jgi:hypothetical protein
MVEHQISFTLNGAELGSAFEVPVHMRNRANALFPAITLKNARAIANFGGVSFRYRPPSGYVGMARAPMEHTVSGALSQESQERWDASFLSYSYQLDCMASQEHLLDWMQGRRLF